MRRREFLAAGAASIGAACLPAFAQAQSGYQRLLILVELKGGNDSLNTVVPYSDPLYGQLRPRIGLKRDEILQLDERTGLHPSLKPLLALWQARELAIVQGLGYPQPNLSHFRSIEIWDTASRSDQFLAEGWLARAFAAQPVPRSYAADGVVVGGSDMGPLSGSGARAIVLAEPEQFMRQARLAGAGGKSANTALNHILRVEADIVQAASQLGAGMQFRTEFPRNPFGNAVRVAAQLAANPTGTAVIRVSLGGFDTHQGQPGQHARLLGELAEGLAALKAALLEANRWDSTLVMTYAEFGRRPQENGTNGTDHGTAAAHFVAGGRVKGGLYGQAPRLSDLDGGNLRYALDFRSLYATALVRWWGVDVQRALGGGGALSSILNGRFEPIELLRA
ncbi:MAG: DUF1501 domain-containing protein [Betaproteobacteria bacterium]|nr:DUF1501 domain-containing protein [Betaproteobacteria bacterium]